MKKRVNVALAHPCAPRHSGFLPSKRSVHAVHEHFEVVSDAEMRRMNLFSTRC